MRSPMRMVSVAAMLASLSAYVVRAQDAGPAAPPAPDVVAAPVIAPTPTLLPQPTLVLVPGPAGFVYRLHDTMVIRASGAAATQVRTLLPNTQPGKLVTLVIDGVPMSNLSSNITDAPPKSDGSGVGDVLITFALERNSSDDANRGAWDMLLSRRSYEMEVPVYLSIANGVAQVVSTGRDVVKLSIAPLGSIEFIGTLAALAMAVLLVLLIRSDVLRDADTGYYSLGRSQMAFWGVIVFVSVVAVFFITDTLERIPLQTLGLLGISGATGLGSLLIGANSGGGGGAAAATVKSATLMRREMNGLKKKMADKTATAEEKARFELLDDHLDRRHFLRDICDDGTGMSFHRVQVVVWTVLLGGVFLRSVARVMSMPEFPESLLLLMGISNATYLGFKFPEKPVEAPPLDASKTPAGS